MENRYEIGSPKIRRAIIFSALLVILISAVFDYYLLVSQRMEKTYGVRLEETGEQLAKSIHRHITSSMTFLEAMAEVFSDYEDIHSAEALECLAKVSGKSDFKRMWLTKQSGEAVSSEGTTSNGSGRAYFTAALNGESGISQMQYSKVNGKRNVVAYVPIYQNEKVIGMVIGIYELDELSDIINIECFDGKGYSHIVRENGEILTHSQKGSEIQGDTTEIAYWKEYGYTCPIGINDWYVFITLPEEIIENDVRFNMWVTVMLCIKFLIILAIIIAGLYQVKNRELRHLAKIDSMTGLLNRGAVEKVINTHLKELHKESAAMLVFDLDHFKAVNDTMGHLAGDTLLVKIAEAIKEEFRKADVAGRLGGDEFVIYMKGIAEKEAVYDRIKKLIARIEQISEELKNNADISISIGIAIAPTDGTDFESLYKKADNCMYEAKKTEGNSYCEKCREESNIG